MKQGVKISKVFFRANERIRAREILLIDENGTRLGVTPFYDAINKARSAGLDLVEISPNEKPPVCKIMDFGRYKYDQQKKEHENRQRIKHIENKEIRLSVNIGAHDLQVKADRAKEFIEKGHRVSVGLKLFGRENMFVDRAYQVIRHFAELCNAELSEEPKKLGNQIRVGLVQKKVKSEK